MESTLQRKVSFGRPVMTPYLIPVLHDSTPRCINAPFMAEGDEYRVTAFSIQGSPFGAVITDNVGSLDVPLHGKKLSVHPLFPKGADIVFVQIENKNSIKVRLYEKEKGEVDFSDKGACAAFVAAKIMQKTYEDEVIVSMNSGAFNVEWDGAEGDVKVNSTK